MLFEITINDILYEVNLKRTGSNLSEIYVDCTTTQKSNKCFTEVKLHKIVLRILLSFI